MCDGSELDELSRKPAWAKSVDPAGAVTDSCWIIPLSRAGECTRPLVGGKAANLGTLLRARMPVPPGFCVTTNAFREFLSNGLSQERRSSMCAKIPETRPCDLAELAGQLTAELQRAGLPAGVEAAILAAWRDQGDTLVYAVRSSATVEDAAGHSFAGQFDSCLNVRGRDALLEAVRRCWISLFSPRALAYGLRAGLAADQMTMAVVVQEMVPAEVAGVTFTVDPVSGNAGRIVIESTSGLGDRLVSGRVTPQTTILARPSLQRVEPCAQTAGSGLPEALYREVGQLALEVETLFGHPVDLEWAAAAGRVFLLQARALTTVNRGGGQGGDFSGDGDRAGPDAERRTGGSKVIRTGFRPPPGPSEIGRHHRIENASPERGSWEDRQIWTNMNTGEVMPDVMTPVTWSMIRIFLERLAKSCFVLVGADAGRAPLVGLVGGRLYFNVNTSLAAVKPFKWVWSNLSRLPDALGGAQATLFKNGLLDLPDEDLPELGFGWGRYVLSLPRMIRALITHSPRRGDAWTAQLKADNEARVGEDYASLSPAELAGRLDHLLEEGLQGWDLLYLVTQGAALPVFDKACRDWLDDPDLATGYRLFCGLGGVPEAEAGLALWRLAQLARANPSTEAVLREQSDWSSVQARLAATVPGRRFLKAWEDFMSEHGHHCRGELELFNARWSETPDYILGVVRSYLTALDRADPLANHRRLARERLQLTARCRQRLSNPLKRWIFTRSLARLQKLAVNREEWKNQAVRLLTGMRRILLALGDQLAHQAVLGLPDDVFFLELAEIRTVAAGRATFDVRALVRQRRAAYDQNLTLTPPPVVFGRFDPSESCRGEDDVPAKSWAGIPVFPGVVTGRARVILRADDHEQVLPGEILVAPFTDPAWTPYFVAAAAVVMDQGGILSHGSIVAREYGLPAVTNVGAATKGIRTGDWIEVDGLRGRVMLLKSGPVEGFP